MHDVRIIFTASKTPLGILIRKITKSDVSHAMIEIPIWDKRMIMEATLGGVRLVPSKKSKHHVVKEYQCQFDTKPGLIDISQKLGDHYDYAGLFVIIWAKIFWDWAKLRMRFLKWKNTSIKCSELVALFFQSCNLPDSDKIVVELSTPEDIKDFCDEHQNLFVEI
jgi:hypothetical protein